MPRRAPRKPRRKIVKRRPRRVPRALVPKKQMAQIVETIEFNRLSPNFVQACTFSIGQFQRASALAANFRWYKPLKVTWKIEPQYGTYQASTGGVTVPYLYTLMNRTQDSSFMTLSDLLTNGCRPVKLVGSKSLTYKPNWCAPALIAANTVPLVGQFGGVVNQLAMAGMTSHYGWLQAPNNATSRGAAITPLFTHGFAPGAITNTTVSNNPCTTLFNGHQYYIEQQVPVVGSTPVYRITCTVVWAFKDPKNIAAAVTDNLFSDISGAVPEVE